MTFSKVINIFCYNVDWKVHASSGTFVSLSGRILLFSIWLRPWFEVWGRDSLVIGSNNVSVWFEIVFFLI